MLLGVKQVRVFTHPGGLVRGECWMTGINIQSFSVTCLQPSIHPFPATASPVPRVGEGAGVRPSCLIVRVGYTLDKLPVHDWANTERQTTIHTHSDVANLPLAHVFELREGAALPGENPHARTHAHTHTHKHAWWSLQQSPWTRNCLSVERKLNFGIIMTFLTCGKLKGAICFFLSLLYIISWKNFNNEKRYW